MALSIDFHELAGSGGSRHSIDQAVSAIRRFLIKWSDRATFLSGMATQLHPTWDSPCAINAISFEPFASDQPPSVVVADPIANDVSYLQNNGFNCLAVVEYNTDFSLAPWPCDVPKPTIPAGTQLVMRTRASSQVLRVPPRKLWSGCNPTKAIGGYVPDPDGPEGRIIIPTTEFQLQWYYVDEPPVCKWEEDYQGRVNETTFLGGEPETILFEGFEFEPSTQFIPTDPFCFTVTCHFRKRRITDGTNIYGWNHEFSLAGWHRVQMKDSANTLVDRYLKAELNDMFVEASCSSSSSGS